MVQPNWAVGVRSACYFGDTENKNQVPSMNIEDRTGLLGDMRESAPPDVFTEVWSLTSSVLSAGDHTALAQRLNIS